MKRLKKEQDRSIVRHRSPIEDFWECKYCGSKNYKKYGIRHNKIKDNLQRIKCVDCGRISTECGPDTCFEILEYLQEHPKGVTIYDLMAELELSRTALLRSLSLLESKFSDYMLLKERVEQKIVYRIGVKVYRFMPFKNGETEKVPADIWKVKE